MIYLGISVLNLVINSSWGSGIRTSSGLRRLEFFCIPRPFLFFLFIFFVLFVIRKYGIYLTHDVSDILQVLLLVTWADVNNGLWIVHQVVEYMHSFIL